jgi:uncharacterized membrane protein
MTEILTNAVDQVPGLVVLVAVVLMFLKYMSKHDDLIKDLTNEHLIERKKQQEVIEKNTVAAATNTAALNNVAHILDEHARTIRNK